MLQDTLEILHFLKPSRQHIKEGLVPDCSKSLLGGGQGFEDMSYLSQSQGLNSSSLHFSSEVVRALIGEPLSEEDLLKVIYTHRLEHHQIFVCNLLVWREVEQGKTEGSSAEKSVGGCVPIA